MSNNVNTILFERARDLQEYFTGQVQERILDRDMEAGDLEALKMHVAEYEAERMLQEEQEDLGYPFDEVTDVN